MYKLLTSSKDGDDLLIGFNRNGGRRGSDLLERTRRGKLHVRIFLKGFFGFAEQEKGTYELGH